MSRSPFSYQQHKETGPGLQDMKNQLTRLSTKLKNAYGERAEVSRLADEARSALDHLRMALQRQAHADCPEEHAVGPSADTYI